MKKSTKKQNIEFAMIKGIVLLPDGTKLEVLREQVDSKKKFYAELKKAYPESTHIEIVEVSSLADELEKMQSQTKKCSKRVSEFLKVMERLENEIDRTL
jgi:hypothetical protein